MISRKKLRKKAFNYDRKKFRKNVLSNLKTIEDTIKSRAKIGQTSYHITLNQNSSWFDLNFLSIRLFKQKNPDFDVKIRFDYDSDEIKDFSYNGADYIYVDISWS